MTLIAGRIPGLTFLQRNHYGEDGNMQGILKSGPTRRFDKSVRMVTNSYAEDEVQYRHKHDDGKHKHDDGKRLVRFSETKDIEKPQETERDLNDRETCDVIMFGNNMYFINNSDPNSAVRKLFPNSKLTPINPFLNKLNSKHSNPSHSQSNKVFGNNQQISHRTKSQSEQIANRNSTMKRIDTNFLRRNLSKVPKETKLGKTSEASTPLIERIKQLTCDNEDTNEIKKDVKEGTTFDHTSRRNFTNTEGTRSLFSQDLKTHHQLNNSVKDLPKQEKEGLNLMRYNQNILQTRSQPTSEKSTSPNKTNVTDEARRSFLSYLSQGTDGEPGDRMSVATSSTTADTVYSLSDIEEVLTEEEKEIKEAFSQENKQDELELFVQQDAGRTERLRKRYSSTPKLHSSMPAVISNINFPLKNSNVSVPYFTNGNSGIKKEKPKFGSTIEILQQLQQQIETPYQLEGRRTACSNYSDSSIPISERLFCDESSDGYEPILPKLNVQRTCSLDSKNYEEIDNFPSAFSVPRTKSHEHPRLAYFESEPHMYQAPSVRYSGNFIEISHPVEQNMYASSPDLHGYHNVRFPNRFPQYSNHPCHVKQQLHPVLQKQYCRYPVHEQPPRPAEEGKVLTPPNRMHTYMNVPSNAPCYLLPPPYLKPNHCTNPSVYPDEYHYDSPFSHSNIYQNIPLPINTHVKTVRRLCTERERGAPEGASSSHDPEIHQLRSNDFYFPSNPATIPKQSSLPHHYCVDV